MEHISYWSALMITIYWSKILYNKENIALLEDSKDVGLVVNTEKV